MQPRYFGDEEAQAHSGAGTRPRLLDLLAAVLGQGPSLSNTPGAPSTHRRGEAHVLRVDRGLGSMSRDHGPPPVSQAPSSPCRGGAGAAVSRPPAAKGTEPHRALWAAPARGPVGRQQHLRGNGRTL